MSVLRDEDERQPISQPGRLPGATWLLAAPVLIAFWVVTRPYYGITHDARLYSMLALEHLDPGSFASDFFLASGSQDTFTGFSALYAPMIAWLGLLRAHAVGLYAAHGLWLAALVWLARTTFPRQHEAILAVAGSMLLSPTYALFGMFGYGEPFLTPRLLAEAAVMGAVTLAMRRRWAASAALLAGGAAMHPLMTLPGIAVVGLLAARERRSVLLFGLILVAIALALGAIGIDPFSRVFRAYDPEWWEIARERGAFTVIGTWTYIDWLRLAPATLVAAMGLLFVGRGGSAASELPGAAPLAIGLLVATVGVAITWVGVDLARNVLVASVQPWRALWLLVLLANCWAPVLAFRLPAGSAARQYLILAIAMAVTEVWMRSPLMTCVPVFAAAFVAQMLGGASSERLRRVGSLAGAFIWMLALAGLGVKVWILLHLEVLTALSAGLALRALVVSGGVLTLVVLLYRRSRIAPALMLLLGLGLVGAALNVYDQRSPWRRYRIEPSVSDDLRAFVAQAGNSIYWEDGVELLWFKLRRPSAWSCIQGAGLIYFRGTAIDFARRARALSSLNTAVDFAARGENDCPAMVSPEAPGPADAEAISAACRAWPELDSIVLFTRFEGAYQAAWRPPVPVFTVGRDGSVQWHDAFYLYRCDIRR